MERDAVLTVVFGAFVLVGACILGDMERRLSDGQSVVSAGPGGGQPAEVLAPRARPGETESAYAPLAELAAEEEAGRPTDP